jgi:hypothetical protein
MAVFSESAWSLNLERPTDSILGDPWVWPEEVAFARLLPMDPNPPAHKRKEDKRKGTAHPLGLVEHTLYPAWPDRYSSRSLTNTHHARHHVQTLNTPEQETCTDKPGKSMRAGTHRQRCSPRQPAKFTSPHQSTNTSQATTVTPNQARNKKSPPAQGRVDLPLSFPILIPRPRKKNSGRAPETPGCGFCAVTQLNTETTAGAPGRVLFSS